MPIVKYPIVKPSFSNHLYSWAIDMLSKMQSKPDIELCKLTELNQLLHVYRI